ncbi:hypothetical protein ASF84_01420 [Pseudomonas sp. Leaf127]|uniref:hypothetical protein n=1 Tax=Pseudomonas sp. Leaf127 TaxID=1736267 RepID=UPI0007037301|nr:hypothetical protein [Pseudomonas sp. Leaf127]KQQ67826.1 hypothetical protein ASF84_01420 [Pseudomonas sp. Leaf127]
MIATIEDLMVHWGEQHARLGLGSGVGSQMGTIMEWKGLPPSGTPGSRILKDGMGLDHIASEVEAAVAELERNFNGAARRGPRLAKLAKLRYLDHATVREQMREVGIAEGADRTYRNWVTALHQQVMTILILRAGPARAIAGKLSVQLKQAPRS